MVHSPGGLGGLSEEDAEDRGLDVEVGDFPYSINGLGMCRGEMSGAVKVVTDSRCGEILGVHIVGTNATELVGEAVMAMQLEATVNELAASIRVHPTFRKAWWTLPGMQEAGRSICRNGKHKGEN